MLIYLAVIAWVLQITLGFLQIRAFNRMLQSMAKKGRVKIGRTQS
ncbi:transcriptional regulator GutM, partial [Vibrio harveyi]